MFRLAARNFAARNIVVRSVAAPRFALAARNRVVPCAAFSAAAGLSKEEITQRVLDVLKGFEKVDQSKLTPTASFDNDLGLDSLDAVEVVMAVEEEFAIEIPDGEADEIKTVQQAIDYIAKTPEGVFSHLYLFAYEDLSASLTQLTSRSASNDTVVSLSINRIRPFSFAPLQQSYDPDNSCLHGLGR
ncbi:acyl carrier protein-like protein [Trametes punicea]|nr:acyl carrier protein-like protein [Trametes punicea]